MTRRITVRVNGVVETADVDPRRSLLAFLREDLDLTGAKEGCNEGECGACVVLVDGKPINSCLMLAVEADGREITTIEGLARDGALHPLQRAFLRHQALQCGFCTPGMILTAAGLLAENPDPTEDEVRRALSGNLCRCTGYRQILDAVLEAAAEMRGAVGKEVVR
ncbi:MAG: (2Fe-2S)-binding protein [Myxococcales bacterium]|nr:(2Fe-2S)-binding protein [Myxococcales bacterium]